MYNHESFSTDLYQLIRRSDWPMVVKVDAGYGVPGVVIRVCAGSPGDRPATLLPFPL